MSSRNVVVAIPELAAQYRDTCFTNAPQIEDVKSHLVITPSAKSTIGVETNIVFQRLRSLMKYIVLDIGASIASGSFKTLG